MANNRKALPRSKTICNGCRFARWDRTATGRLSPHGTGRCRHPVYIEGLPVTLPRNLFVDGSLCLERGEHESRLRARGEGWIERTTLSATNRDLRCQAREAGTFDPEPKPL